MSGAEAPVPHAATVAGLLLFVKTTGNEGGMHAAAV